MEPQNFYLTSIVKGGIHVRIQAVADTASKYLVSIYLVGYLFK